MVAGAALAAGLVNAVAGGGSLISFPALVAIGVPSVIANVTNAVALIPGYLGATLAQRRELAGQGRRIARIVPIGLVAGAGGALLLLETGERAFEAIVPFLILLAAMLVAAQDRLRRWLVARTPAHHAENFAMIPIALIAVYGGYFGAGMGVMVLAALGILMSDGLVKLNALKQLLAFVVNVAAGAVFVARGHVVWELAGTMAGASLVGGALGGIVSKHVPAAVLRAAVVLIGVVVAVVYFAKTYWW